MCVSLLFFYRIGHIKIFFTELVKMYHTQMNKAIKQAVFEEIHISCTLSRNPIEYIMLWCFFVSDWQLFIHCLHQTSDHISLINSIIVYYYLPTRVSSKRYPNEHCRRCRSVAGATLFYTSSVQLRSVNDRLHCGALSTSRSESELIWIKRNSYKLCICVTWKLNLYTSLIRISEYCKTIQIIKSWLI